MIQDQGQMHLRPYRSQKSSCASVSVKVSKILHIVRPEIHVRLGSLLACDIFVVSSVNSPGNIVTRRFRMPILCLHEACVCAAPRQAISRVTDDAGVSSHQLQLPPKNAS